jgi:hypothetical protein
MARTSVAGELPLRPDEAWSLMSDLSRFGDWLTIHGGWVGDLPALEIGARFTEQLVTMGLSSTVVWTIDHLEPPHELRITGVALAGSQIEFTMSVAPEGDHSRVEVDVALGGQLLTGPIGLAVEQNVQTELSKSLVRLQELAGTGGAL